MMLESAAPAALLARLSDQARRTLARTAALAAGQQAGLWLVGGVVRDLMLGVDPGRDVDLAVEGDATALASALASELGGRVLASHAAFGTATVVAAGEAPLLIDLAQTRLERYPRPAALPEVRPGSIADDLIRRDFSINAMAVELRGADGQLTAGRLLDPFGGQHDLAARRLRLLHAASLRDDPTRILRGLRLAARLGLSAEPATGAQIADALERQYLGLLSEERVLGELCLALEEPRPDAVLRLADGWGVTPQTLPWLGWGPQLTARCGRFAEAAMVGRAQAEPRLVWAGLLLYDLDASARSALAARYPLPSDVAALLAQVARLRELAPQLALAGRASEIERLLRPFSAAAVAVLHYAEPAAAEAAMRYLQVLRHVRLPLDGHDLQRLGAAPGPGMRQLIEALRAAVLDGAVTSRAEAERWAQAQLAGAGKE